METYNVILHKGVDYQSFWDDMELSDDGGTLHIPNRRVDSTNLRPNSPRQSWYTLSSDEVNTLKNDSRVLGIEIPPEFRDDIQIEHRATQTGDFTKTTSDSGAFLNWGLIRHKSKTNNYADGSTITKVVKVVSPQVYEIDNVSQPTLVLNVGTTYKFDVSDSSNGSHPFRFQKTSDNSNWTTFVTINGTQGQSGAYVQIVVTDQTPNLNYYCTVHSGMGGSITINQSALSETSEDYTYTLDGSNVDIVIQDSGVEFAHAEFKGPDGVERTVTIDWYSLSGVTGTQNTNHDRDYDGHGTHVAGTAAGRFHGVAKNANVYFVKVSGLEGASDSGTGISTTDCFDVIKGWHNNKVANPLTGVINPTVVNMSWGYSTSLTNDNISAINYRGTSYTGGDIDTASERESNYGLMEYQPSVGVYSANVRILSVDTDVEELIDAGIHVTIAAGNRGNKCDIPGGDDYNNYFTRSGTDVYYHRGSSPNADGAILVGNLDSATKFDNSTGQIKDQKAASSECGPAVDIYAAGTNIMSCTSNTNRFSDAVYNFDSNYRQCNISGTSMAAPQVAGLAALLLQVNPQAPPSAIKSVLQSNAGTTTLYTTAANNAWTDSRSLLGGETRIMFNKFTSNSPTILKNTPSGLFQGGVKLTTK